MRIQRSSVLLLIGLSCLLLRSPSAVAGATSSASTADKTNSYLSPTKAVQAAQSLLVQPGAVDPAYQIYIDAEDVGVSPEDGEIRSFRIKDDVQVSRSQFFPRYRQNLRLGKDDVIEEHKVLDLPKFGWVFSRHRQKYKGLEVLGAEYVLQEKDGRVGWAHGKFEVDLNLDVTPEITETAALGAALEAVNAEIYDWEADPENESPPKGLLAIVSKRLVYRFIVSSKTPRGSWTIDVDAKTGGVVNKANNFVETPQDVPCQGDTYYGLQTLTCQEVDKEGGGVGYQLKEDGPPPIETLIDLGKALPETDIGSDPYLMVPRIATVHWAAEKAVQYYKEKFGWIGVDGVGKSPVISVLLSLEAPENACAWHDRTKKAIFFPIAGVGIPCGVSLGAAGHEFTHGVTDYAVEGLELPYKSETRSINEGFANIFGGMIKKNILGEAFYPNYDSPSRYKGAGYILPEGCEPNNDNDQCGQHINGAVLEWWFAILDIGAGTPGDPSSIIEGVGFEKAEQIAFLTMIGMFPTTTFYDARLISESIAIALHGRDSPEHQAVLNAWHLVGIGDHYQIKRTYSPPPGATQVESWVTPVKFSSSVLPDEYRWTIEIATDTNFSENLLQGTVTAVTVGPGNTKSAVFESHLNAGTLYFWRVSGKRLAPAERASSGSTRASSRATGRAPSRKASGNLLQRVIGFFQSNDRAPEQPPGAAPKKRASGAPTRASNAPKKATLSAQALDSKTLPSQKLILEEEEEQDWSSPAPYFITASKRRMIIFPAGGNSTHPWEAVLKYGSVDAGHGSQVQVVEDEQFFPQFLIASKTTSALEQTFKLKKDTWYRWRVRAIGPKNADGENTTGEWSLPENGIKFKTAIPQTPLKEPANNASLAPWGFQLIGDTVKGAEKYRVQVSKNSNLSAPLFDSGVVNAPSATVSLGQHNAPYYWGIFPFDQDKNEWGTTQIRSFTVDYNKTKPNLISPNGNQVPFKQPDLQYRWYGIQGSPVYKISVYRRNASGGVGQFLYDYAHASSGTTDPINFNVADYASYASDKSGYCWTVQAFGPDGQEGLTSNPACYGVDPPVPTLVSPANGAVNVNYAPTQFQWQCSYCQEYSSDISYFINAGGSGSQVTGTTTSRNTEPGSLLNWNVALRVAGKTVSTSPTWTFTTKSNEPAPDSGTCSAPSAPTANFPGCTLADLETADYNSNLHCYYILSQNAYKPPTYTWSAVSGATQYELTVTHAGGPVLFKQTYSGTSATPGFHHTTTGWEYHWSVRAKKDCSSWSGPSAKKAYITY